MATRTKPELSVEVALPAGTGGRLGNEITAELGVEVGSTTGVGEGVGVEITVGVGVCPGWEIAEAGGALDLAIGGATETNTTSPAMMATSTEARNRIEPIETALRRTSLSKPQRKAIGALRYSTSGEHR